MTSRGPWADIAQRLFFLLVVRPFLTLFIGIRVKGREHLPMPSQGPFLLIANHSSHLDTVSLLALLPLSELRHMRAVAAADYFERSRFVSLLTRTLFNTLPIARKGITPENDPREKMLQALRRGESLLLFPEGTRRSSEEEAGRFKRGVATLVERFPDLRVVPAYLVNMGRSLPKGRWVPVPFFCEVHVGPPRVLSEGPSDRIVAELEEAVRGLKG